MFTSAVFIYPLLVFILFTTTEQQLAAVLLCGRSSPLTPTTFSLLRCSLTFSYYPAGSTIRDETHILQSETRHTHTHTPTTRRSTPRPRKVSASCLFVIHPRPTPPPPLLQSITVLRDLHAAFFHQDGALPVSLSLSLSLNSQIIARWLDGWWMFSVSHQVVYLCSSKLLAPSASPAPLAMLR